MIDVNSEKRFICSRRIITSEQELIFNHPLEENERSAFMTSMVDFIYRNKKNHKEFILNVCKEKVLTANIVMYFQKNFFLKDEINEVLNQALTFGLLQHWFDTHVDSRFLFVRNDETVPEPLNVEQLIGIISVWAFGCAISLAAFIIEIFIPIVRKALNSK